MGFAKLRCLTLGWAILLTIGALPGLPGAGSKTPAGAGVDILVTPPGGPKTITVTDLVDLSPGSLRQAVSNANSGDTINFAPNLSGFVSLSYNGEIPIAKDLTIIGPGARNLTITITQANSRVFHITSGKVNISGLTIMSGGIAVDTLGDLTVDACAFTHNSSGSSGGGLYNAGRATVTDSTFLLNSAGAKGGAIYNGSNAVLTLQNDTFDSNNAASGGGIGDDGSLSYVTNCTIVNNVAKSGNGGGMAGGNHTSTKSTICAGNTVSNTGTGPDVSGTFESAGYNLIGIADGSTGFTKTGDRIGTAASPFPATLSVLRDNGGPTDTIAPLPNSAAIDGGLSALATDQRGRAHYDDPAVANAQGGDGSDIGACEATPPAAWVVTNLADSGAGSLRQAMQDAASGETVTFAPGLTGSIVLLLGELTFSKNYNIIGPGANIITISGNGVSRVFNCGPGVVNLSGLTMTAGNSQGFGGCINNSGVLIINSCTIASSIGGLYGGGLYNSGQLTVKNCSVYGNSSATRGGGIMNDLGVLTIQNSTISGNTSQSGGGIYTSGANSSVTSCTIAANTASSGTGGGLFCSQTPPCWQQHYCRKFRHQWRELPRCEWCCQHRWI